MMCCPPLSELPAPPRGKKGWPWTEETPQSPDTMPDGQTWPKISIVTPSFNQGRFIEETIRSVLLQGYPNLEYIIIDGGSTDNSIEIIKKYEKWLAYWVSEPDRGQSHAINKGFEKATGKIYAWLNSDDYFLKDALRNIAMAYHTSPKAGAWCGGCLLVNAEGNTLRIHRPNRVDVEGIADWSKNYFAQPSCPFSEEAWRAFGPLEEELHYEMDFALWLKIAKDLRIQKLESVLAAAHIHGDSKIGRGEGPFKVEQVSIQIRHGYERLAIRDINQWMAQHAELEKKYEELRNKLNRIYRFPLLRPIMPIARIIWGKLI